jgi:hypothetical protein
MKSSMAMAIFNSLDILPDIYVPGLLFAIADS